MSIFLFSLDGDCFIFIYTRLQKFNHPISNVTTIKSLELFSRNLREDFFLKIGIHWRAKVYTKNVPNIEECDFIPAPLRTQSIKQVIVVIY